MKIALASDHAGFDYKERIKAHLIAAGHEVVDFGTESAESCDYPDFVRPAAQAVADGSCERGIVLGGSGNGEAIVSNRIAGIRSYPTASPAFAPRSAGTFPAPSLPGATTIPTSCRWGSE